MAREVIIKSLFKLAANSHDYKEASPRETLFEIVYLIFPRIKLFFKDILLLEESLFRRVFVFL